MKWHHIFLAGIIGFSACTQTALAEHRALLPRVQQVAYAEGNLPLKGLGIRFAMKPNAQDQFAAEQLANGLSAVLRENVSVQHGKGLTLERTSEGPDVPVDNESAGPNSRESYSITITAKGVDIKARTSVGLFYGVQTLLQMVEGEGSSAVLPEATVQDWPALAYRAFMMDFSHGQLLKVSEIERQLDLLARYKANQYFFYSEMNIEWDGYSIINPGGRYTQAEVRQVIAYARQRHIDVVPCMELFGHMHDLFRTEMFSDIGLPLYGEEFDQRNPKALKVVDDLFDQASKLFPSPWIHVGFDEPWSLGKIGMTPGRDPYDTFIGVLQHLTDRGREHGKRVMYWADINNGASTLSNRPDLIKRLPAGAIAAPWAYDPFPDYTQFVKPLATNGIATMVTPAIWNWNEVFPDYHRSFFNINGLVEAGKKEHTLGVLNTGWTDCSQTLYRQSLAGLAFGAVAGWQTDPVNTNTFFNEYTAIEYPPAAAPEVAMALEQLSTVEEMFEDILGGATQHAFWKDPLEPSRLKRFEKRQADLHKARLLAEEAQEHVNSAMRLAPKDTTLNSLMMAARLFDYLGMKCLYAVEWDGYFKLLQKNPDPKLVTLYIGIQINAQYHSMMSDLMDTITDLREPYRQAWLDENTPYRLDAALVKWDAESRFWHDTWERVEHLLRTRKAGEPFPSIEVMRARE